MTGKGLAPRVDPGVWDHPKTIAVARQCQLEPHRVVYHLTRMWSRVLRDRTGGLLLRGGTDQQTTAPALAAFGRDVDFQHGPQNLLLALLKARFVEQRGHDFWVHDWSDWQDGAAARAPASISKTGTRYSGTGSTGTTGIDTRPEVPVLATQDDENYRYSGGRIGGAGGKEKCPCTAHDDCPNGQAPFRQFMWWITKGFASGSYERDPYDPKHVTQSGRDVEMAHVAECYIAIDRGLFGDDYDQRNLTARHALKKRSSFVQFKRRKRVHGSVIDLTAAGTKHYPSVAGCSSEVAGANGRTAARSTGTTDPFAGTLDNEHVELSEKARQFRARQTPECDDVELAF